MAKLVIEHKDFTLEIKGENVLDRYRKAEQSLGKAALHCLYTFSTPYTKAYLADFPAVSSLFIDETTEFPSFAEGNPFFFDYTDYSITVIFRNYLLHIPPEDAGIRTGLESVRKNFDYHPQGAFLTGFLNFQNDIGNSDLTIDYTINGEERSFTFSFQVLSAKLDYHTHWKKIVEDIEQEYRLLALDYLKQTYHAFTKNPAGESSDLIWWNLFKAKHRDFIKASRFILDRPRRKVRLTVEHLKADKMKRLTPQLENQLAEYRNLPGHRYRYEENILSNDTPENRFFKYAVNSIARSFNILADLIIQRYAGNTSVTNLLSKDAKDEIQIQKNELSKLRHHPFFRSVGKFSGLNQESLILQRAGGYSTVAQIYILLKAAYSLQKGEFSLETKNIAELYEIWCFIEIKNIVQQLFGQTQAENINRPELNDRFCRSLEKGAKSKVLFKQDGIELAELYYNPKTSEFNDDGIPLTVSPSGVAQKPDIVLQLSRKFLDSPIKLTYLFDAKYRLQNDTGNGFDQPPDDAINQMHRYRDAIYYQDLELASLRKEVIGGYILFPGKGDDLERQSFYKSIEKINIGAFPLRPYDEENRKFLIDFIRKLIEEDTQKHIAKTIPYKGQDAIPYVPAILQNQFIFYTVYNRADFDKIVQMKMLCIPETSGDHCNITTLSAAEKKWLFVELRTDDASVSPHILPLCTYVGIMKGTDINSMGWIIDEKEQNLKFHVWETAGV